MLFNSLSFLIFFPLVVILYYTIPSRWQVFFLLFASCLFYMAFVPAYVLILFFLITVDYFMAQAINKKVGQKRKLFLILSLLTNLGILFVFKYFNFFNTNVAVLADFFHWNYSLTLIKIALPLGLSFHVFQSLSYVIEVYRGKHHPETNYLTYALYVMFFPQLVAGPIERPGHLLPQFKVEHKFDQLKVRRGLERMLWGFFKKLVIADRLAIMVNYMYADLPTDGPALIILMILFAYQLYCDFSGYSDIALGAASVLGYDLSENFNRPYASRSVSDFWRRWHISLSNWLRDYLYYPLALGWGKKSKAKLYFSLFITFVLIGLWHGANWTFVMLGALHGFYLVFASATAKFRQRVVSAIGLAKMPKLYHFWQTLVVFVLVSFSWIFFRAESLTQAWQFISHLVSNFYSILNPAYLRYELFTNKTLGVVKINLLGVVSAIGFMELIQYYQTKFNDFYIFEKNNKILRYSWYYLLIFSILIFGFLGAQNFIYFQF